MSNTDHSTWLRSGNRSLRSPINKVPTGEFLSFFFIALLLSKASNSERSESAAACVTCHRSCFIGLGKHGTGERVEFDLGNVPQIFRLLSHLRAFLLKYSWTL